MFSLEWELKESLTRNLEHKIEHDSHLKRKNPLWTPFDVRAKCNANRFCDILLTCRTFYLLCSRTHWIWLGACGKACYLIFDEFPFFHWVVLCQQSTKKQNCRQRSQLQYLHLFNFSMEYGVSCAVAVAAVVAAAAHFARALFSFSFFRLQIAHFKAIRYYICVSRMVVKDAIKLGMHMKNWTYIMQLKVLKRSRAKNEWKKTNENVK